MIVLDDPGPFYKKIVSPVPGHPGVVSLYLCPCECECEDEDLGVVHAIVHAIE